MHHSGEAPPAEWNVHHVMRWLGHLDLGQYCTVFQQHDIHGKELLELSYQDMKVRGLSFAVKGDSVHRVALISRNKHYPVLIGY